MYMKIIPALSLLIHAAANENDASALVQKWYRQNPAGGLVLKSTTIDFKVTKLLTDTFEHMEIKYVGTYNLTPINTSVKLKSTSSALDNETVANDIPTGAGDEKGSIGAVSCYKLAPGCALKVNNEAIYVKLKAELNSVPVDKELKMDEFVQHMHQAGNFILYKLELKSKNLNIALPARGTDADPFPVMGNLLITGSGGPGKSDGNNPIDEHKWNLIQSFNASALSQPNRPYITKVHVPHDDAVTYTGHFWDGATAQEFSVTINAEKQKVTITYEKTNTPTLSDWSTGMVAYVYGFYITRQFVEAVLSTGLTSTDASKAGVDKLSNVTIVVSGCDFTPPTTDKVNGIAAAEIASVELVHDKLLLPKVEGEKTINDTKVTVNRKSGNSIEILLVPSSTLHPTTKFLLAFKNIEKMDKIKPIAEATDVVVPGIKF